MRVVHQTEAALLMHVSNSRNTRQRGVLGQADSGNPEVYMEGSSRSLVDIQRDSEVLIMTSEAVK